MDEADAGSRLNRWDGLAILGSYVLAAAVRLPLFNADHFSDEPISYYFSLLAAAPPENLHGIDGSPWPFYPSSWFFERPAFYILLAPGALTSFDAYRILFILLSSTLPPLAFVLVRQHGGPVLVASLAAATIALHPQFVTWGTIVHMDSLMTVLLAAALYFGPRRTPLAGGLLLLTAVWVKEVAIAFVAFLFAIELVRQWRRSRRLRPLTLDRWSAALLAILVLGLMPFHIAQEMGFGIPGQTGAGQGPWLFDHLFLSIFLLPPILLGLRWRRTRETALWALSFPFLFLALHLVTGQVIREWYLVAPAFFSVVAASSSLSEFHRRANRRPSTMARWFAPAASALVLLAPVLETTQGVGPDTALFLNPASRTVEPSLASELAFQSSRNPANHEVLERLDATTDLRLLVLVDVHYAFHYHPMPEYAHEVRVVYTSWLVGQDGVVDDTAAAVENAAVLTVVQTSTAGPNEAFRSVYADCKTFDNYWFVFIEGNACSGRVETLRTALYANLEPVR